MRTRKPCSRRLARQGLQQFVQDTVAPLAQLVGVAWEEARLHVFDEHLLTELTERVLRQAIAAVPGGREPCILLTTVPNEQHAMGLLMAEALLSLEGAQCISLGTQMPLLKIARAAAAHRADVVALSFSAAFPKRQIPGLLEHLRQALPAATQLWAGGGGVSRIPAPDGVLGVRDAGRDDCRGRLARSQNQAARAARLPVELRPTQVRPIARVVMQPAEEAVDLEHKALWREWIPGPDARPTGSTDDPGRSEQP